LYKLIESRESWDKKLNLKDENNAIKEITFWQDNLQLYNKRLFTPYKIVITSGVITLLVKNE